MSVEGSLYHPAQTPHNRAAILVSADLNDSTTGALNHIGDLMKEYRRAVHEDDLARLPRLKRRMAKVLDYWCDHTGNEPEEDEEERADLRLAYKTHPAVFLPQWHPVLEEDDRRGERNG